MNEPDERRRAGSADTSHSIHGHVKGKVIDHLIGIFGLPNVYVERGRTEERIEDGNGATRESDIDLWVHGIKNIGT